MNKVSRLRLKLINLNLKEIKEDIRIREREKIKTMPILEEFDE